MARVLRTVLAFLVAPAVSGLLPALAVFGKTWLDPEQRIYALENALEYGGFIGLFSYTLGLPLAIVGYAIFAWKGCVAFQRYTIAGALLGIVVFELVGIGWVDILTAYLNGNITLERFSLMLLTNGEWIAPIAGAMAAATFWVIARPQAHSL
ncbi:MAG: hypothetical protein ACM30I_08150 [Gemmatimonas sp.]